MNTIRNIFLTAVITGLGFFSGCGGGGSAGDGSSDSSSEPLRIAYSDWPGWVAWEIGIQKGFFKDAGVNVEFTWLDYVASMDSFAAGKVDSVCMTNGDALVTGATGKKRHRHHYQRLQ
jgi:ABC-type nitrate/sulfonate/bicarbonate transport system substrate-binding protein